MTRRISPGMGIAILLVSGCPAVHGVDDAGEPVPDLGVLDTPSDAPVCRPEVCDGLDSDCDGVVDDGATCVLPDASESSCRDGRCEVARCADGFLDCDEDPSNGCEASASSRDTCGACDAVCRVSEVCEGGGAAFSCVRDPIVDVDPQLMYTTVLLASGRLVAFGEGIPMPSGERVDAPTPIVIEGAPFPATAMASTGRTMFAIVDGHLYGWGSNGSAELGLGYVSDPDEVFETTEVPLDRPVHVVAAGSVPWMGAIGDDDRPRWWAGERVGDTTVRPPENVSPRTSLTLLARPAVDLSVAADGLAVRYEPGQGAQFIGDNSTGVMDGQPARSDAFWTDGGCGGASQWLDCGRNHCCNVFVHLEPTRLGVSCWGQIAHGALGWPTEGSDRLDPTGTIGVPWFARVRVPFGDALVQVAASDTGASFALLESGLLYGWGAADAAGTGAIWDDVHEPQDLTWSRPTIPSGVPFVTAVFASHNACAVIERTRLYCWGDNVHGALGASAEDAMRDAPLIRTPAAVVGFE